MADRCRILVSATKRRRTNDEARILELLSDHDVALYSFDPDHKG
jgi:hypothetical protein